MTAFTLCCGAGGKPVGELSACPYCQDLYAGSTDALPWGVVEVGTSACSLVWSPSRISFLQAMPRWEKFQPWKWQ